MNTGSSIALNSNVGAALVWNNGGQMHAFGTISATNTWGIHATNNYGFDINNHGNISGRVGFLQHGSALVDLVNHGSGQITGTLQGMAGFSGTMIVTNAGQIRGTGAGAIGIYAESTNLEVDNFSMIRGHAMGVYATNRSAQIDNSGSIIGDSSPAIRLGAGGTIINHDHGEITSYGGEGIFLDEGGTVSNLPSASIVGLTTGVRGYQGAATVTNYGTIMGHNSHGVRLEFGGTVNNETGGEIMGDNTGVSIAAGHFGASLHNRGQITGDNGGGHGMGVNFTNGGGQIVNDASGAIHGADTGVQMSGNGNQLDNFGQITGATGHGVSSNSSVNLVNRTGGAITGKFAVKLGSQSNFRNHVSADITSSGSNGVAAQVGFNTDLTNAGRIIADATSGKGLLHAGGNGHVQIFNAETGLIRSYSTAVTVTGDIPTIWNSGLIQSAHAEGIIAHGVGNLANDSNGEIESQLHGVLIMDGGGAASFQNAGSITSSLYHGVEIRRAGSILWNSGTINGYLNNTDVAGVCTQAAVEINNYGTIYGGNGIYSSNDLLTVNNQGLIHGQNYHAIQSWAGVNLTNSSVIRSSSDTWGAIVNIGGPLTIVNSGLIEGVTTAIYHGGPGEANITNYGRITNQIDSVMVSTGGTLINDAVGTIEGHSSSHAIRGFNSVINRGSIVTPSDSCVAIETPASNGNTVRLYTGSTVIGRIIDIGGTNDEFVLDGEGTSVFDQIVSGFESMHKSNIGTWTFSGTANGITGGLQVHAGTFIVNGTLHIIDGDVNDGATLKGNGTIDGISNGTLFIHSGATLAPGNSIGGLTITDHNLHLHAGSTLEIEVNPFASDWIDVSGEVHLAGTLSIKDLSGGTITNGTQYNFLSSGSGFFGNFSDIIDDSGILSFTVSPNGAFLMLTAVRTANFMDVARTPNEKAIAAVLDAAMSDGELNDLIDQLIGMSSQQIQRAFQRLSARTSGAASQAAAIVIQRIGQDTTQVARNLRMGLGATASNSRSSWSLPGGTLLASAQNDPQVFGAAMAAAESGDNAQPISDDRRWNLYISPFGQFGSMDPGINRSGYEFAAGGVFGGIDYQLDDNHVVGWSVAYAHTNVDLDGGAGDAKINSVRFGTVFELHP